MSVCVCVCVWCMCATSILGVTVTPDTPPPCSPSSHRVNSLPGLVGPRCVFPFSHQSQDRTGEKGNFSHFHAIVFSNERKNGRK
uniref:Putative secreted protein n=1 Tax=Anopheles darlingi TaxID=43151 RepID=A0A2M4D3T0_ANODA